MRCLPPVDPVGLVVLVGLAALGVWPWLPPGGRRLRPRARAGRSRTGQPGRPGRPGRQGRQGQPVDDAVVLDLVSAALAAGTSVVGALESVGAALPAPQGTAYARAARALRMGSTWEDAWRQGGTGATGSPGLPVDPRRWRRSGAATAGRTSVVADALRPAWHDGVDPEPLLRHAAATIRRERRDRAREAAARLGVRLVLPLGLCLLPAFVLLGLVPVLISAGLDLFGG